MQQNPNHLLEQRLRDGLSQAAVPPPPDMWARIEAQLPDATDIAITAALSDADIAPPTGIWEKIATLIDNVATQETASHTTVTANEIDDLTTLFLPLRDHAVEPSAKVWAAMEPFLPLEKIEDISFAALATHEVAPPADLWSRLETTLDDLEENRTDAGLAVFAALGQAEVTPRRDMWAFLDTQLEDEDELIAFNALGAHEVTPPTAAWERVAADLEAEEAKEKRVVAATIAGLASAEVAPEADMWSRIEARLEEDDDAIGGLANRLRNADMKPPRGSWDKISENLPLNPALGHHLRNFSRVAAVVLVALTASVFYEQWKNQSIDGDTVKEHQGAIAKIDQKSQSPSNPKGSNTTTIYQKDKVNNGVHNNQNARQLELFENHNNNVDNNIDDNAIAEINSSNPVITPNDFIPKVKKTRRGGQKNRITIGTDWNNVVESVSNSQNGIAATPQKGSNYIINNKVTNNDVNNSVNKEENQDSQREKRIVDEIATLGSSNLNNFVLSLEQQRLTIQELQQITGQDFQQLTNAQLQQLYIDYTRQSVEKALDAQFSDYIIKTQQTLPSIDPNFRTVKDDSPVEDLINKYRGLTVGVNGRLCSPYLFNNRILNDLRPVAGDIDQTISVKLGFGAAVGYQFAKRQNVNLEYNYTPQGQSYNLKTPGRIDNVIINADYHTLALLYQHQFALQSNQSAISLIAGPQFGFLNAASFRVDGSELIRREQLASSDFGGMLGADYNFFLSKRTILSAGVRAAYSQDLSRLGLETLGNFNASLRFGATYRLHSEVQNFMIK